MPIIRVENWLSVEWKYRVAPEILRACMSARVPGIDHEREVTVVFGGEIIREDYSWRCLNIRPGSRA